MSEVVQARSEGGADSLPKIAAEVFEAIDCGGRQVQPFSARYSGFTLADGYRVSALAHGMRIAHGFRPVGRKIGFTNRNIWPEYGVYAPNWGFVYDRTTHDLAQPLSLAAYHEAKIEPEIMFGLAAAPSPDMNEVALLNCIAWVAHGFEIVQSIFPNWRFKPADTSAANAMHAALLVGHRHDVRGRESEWLRMLPTFEVELFRDGELMDRGCGANVLDGPLSALKHLAEMLAVDPDNPALAAGEIVSTGTLTRALPCHAGETWSTKLKGIALEGVSLCFV